jgi:Fe-S cluster assembly protein SufD
MNSIADQKDLTGTIRGVFDSRGFGSDPIRAKALDLFLTKGFPGPKSEEYKYTRITAALNDHMRPNSVVGRSIAESYNILVPGLAQCNQIVFVNGHYSRERSILIDRDIEVELSEGIEPVIESDPFDLLNQALSFDVMHIKIKPGKVIANPVAIVHYMDPEEFLFSNTRWRCTVGTNSEVTIVEYNLNPGQGRTISNNHSLIQVARNAHLEYVRLQNDPSSEIEVTNSKVQLESSSSARLFTFTFDGQLIRNNLEVTIDGQGVDAHLYGLYLTSKNHLIDNHTVVDHRLPNSYSNELYKGVMGGLSRGVFNGKIYVRPHAQKTNAFQTNRNILLSDAATINTKPQLEIWADDVKCSHGCTTGQLDEEALFYLRSRGIPKDMARGMMLYAFASETLTPMRNEGLKNFIDGLVSEKLDTSF